MTEQPQVRIGKLMPNWMINLTDRIMQYYIDRYLNCDPVVLDRPPEPQPGHQYLLYAHIPFCKTLCSYCTFHRFLFKEHKAREYFINLRKEMDYVKALGYDFTSMYIGGGTTTILEDELIRTIEHARTLFPGIKEVSCETDPLQIATPTFRNLKGLVDRMSIGVQSFNDDILKMTERYDKFGSGALIYERLQEALELFPTTNVDMIFGFRGQNLEMLQRDMDLLVELNPRQITTYPLMVTSQTRKSVKQTIAAKGIELADQYAVIMNTLGNHYRQLTSWTFGRTHDEGFDEYVVDHDEYLGVGSGAFSFLGSSLYVNTFSLRRYNERIKAGMTGVERRRNFDKHAVLQYRLLLGLFSARLSRKYFREVHGVDLDKALFKEMLGLRIAGAIKDNPEDPDNLIVTDAGKFLGLVMMKAFYSGMDNVRAELRKPLRDIDC
ncbi:coproporphyrinogen III oxidase family protein [Sutterella sp. AM11-39]|mgnify:FL=1|jgi:coproporphyrinogen III oxidase-like Fe-S oxidoreductase|uniref:coproporphyrinogen III oxidase family protein n=1 Tax=Sutterella sp. AM11-39 TaxID=2292075 RepID=UPI000E470708|nr:coproporphyrinogen III oxidase family protein [Sutterella sp. AM11-39]RHJ32933.1 coproporphyrinogen III oxidase family protein [Sutterella sp. AM11-39]